MRRTLNSRRQRDRLNEIISIPNPASAGFFMLGQLEVASMPLPALTLAVVGADYPNKRGPGRRFEIQICQPGEPIELRPEPKNPADPRAVAVFSCREVQIGYLTAERCGRIGQLIKQGMEVVAIFQEATQHGALIRVAFDGELPVLPEPRQESQVDPDFYPDEEWPDS